MQSAQIPNQPASINQLIALELKAYQNHLHHADRLSLIFKDREILYNKIANTFYEMERQRNTPLVTYQNLFRNLQAFNQLLIQFTVFSRALRDYPQTPNYNDANIHPLRTAAFETAVGKSYHQAMGAAYQILAKPKDLSKADEAILLHNAIAATGALYMNPYDQNALTQLNSANSTMPKYTYMRPLVGTLTLIAASLLLAMAITAITLVGTILFGVGSAFMFSAAIGLLSTSLHDTQKATTEVLKAQNLLQVPVSSYSFFGGRATQPVQQNNNGPTVINQQPVYAAQHFYR